VPTKRRAKKAKAKPRKRVTAETRASDDELRRKLDQFDVRVLDKALGKAIKIPPPAR
jgi:hypothetical protein